MSQVGSTGRAFSPTQPAAASGETPRNPPTPPIRTPQPATGSAERVVPRSPGAPGVPRDIAQDAMDGAVRGAQGNAGSVGGAVGGSGLLQAPKGKKGGVRIQQR